MRPSPSPLAFTSLLLAIAACASTPVDPYDPGGDPGEPPPPGMQSTPFGSHRMAYPAGTIRPTGAQADLDAAVASFYDRWKSAYLIANCGGQVIRTGGGTGAGNALTVSEGHGYGMLITAIMAGHDPRAQELFDGLYKVFRAQPSNINRQLMAWAIGSDCKAIQPANSATDGDLDIAFALLLANRQWGSAGRHRLRRRGAQGDRRHRRQRDERHHRLAAAGRLGPAEHAGLGHAPHRTSCWITSARSGR